MTRTLTYLLYWLCQAIAFPVVLLYLARRISKNRQYAGRLTERFGILPDSLHPTLPGSIWLHAVSVGEIVAAVPLIRAMLDAFPQTPVYVSTSTLAGRSMAEQKLQGLAADVFYAPLDYRFAVRRVLRRLRPQVLVVMETEIWPNLYREAKLSGAGVVIVNGRISDKALPRYRRYAWFFRQALFYADTVLAQDETAAARFRMLGAGTVEVAGNLKYDFDPASARMAEDLERWLRAVAPEKVFVAASTMPPAREGDTDEDDLLIDAWRKISEEHPDALLVLVPRRPERFDTASAKLSAAGIEHTRRTALGPPTKVLLLDTIGELNALFRHATLVFMGGTVAERGGHNVLEPAAFGVPVICGPHMENFAEIAAEFDAAGAIVRCEGTALAATVNELLADPASRSQLGKVAKTLAEAKRGATARAVVRIADVYDASQPRPRARWFAKPWIWLWRAGVAVDRMFKSFGMCTPGAHVISVGNLAMGGTGKTPLVLWLCKQLTARGMKTAVLTRGYGRRQGREIEVFLPGDRPNVRRTGEEAALVLRQGKAAVGIGANRCSAWLALAPRFGPRVVVLDDGFQHWRMRRDVDLVLLDALDPFRGGMFPSGRLREPFRALRRASAVVITKAAPGRKYSGLIEEIRRHDCWAPVFLARTQARLPEADLFITGAFCGIAQPEAFRRTLTELGIDPVFFETFPDHHHYTIDEIRSLKARAPVLVTTEKDLMNIGEELRPSIHAIPIEMVFDDTEGFLRALSLPGSR